MPLHSHSSRIGANTLILNRLTLSGAIRSCVGGIEDCTRFFFDLIKLFFDDSNIFLIFGKTVVR